jgi:cell fate regulator YaaT (PSP1 superfamily)
MNSSDIICVKSNRSGKVFYARRGKTVYKTGEFVIIESDLGGDVAEVVDVNSPRCQGLDRIKDTVKILREATEEDEKKIQWLLRKEGRAFEFCLKKINERNLPMKLVAVRYFFNEKKGIFYYTADGRIDFRQLVKDLAKEFKMRIEMRQIGVRDEAKMIGGLGVCGRELCCASFMKNFEPVTIQKAKKQQIVINPTKISGLCGRLMCCLAFEDESRGRMYTEEEKVEE